MTIQALSIPTLQGGVTPGYPGYVQTVVTKVNELASLMGLSALAIYAALGGGSPASDLNAVVAKVNDLITAQNAITTSQTVFNFSDNSAGFAQNLFSVPKNGYCWRSPHSYVQFVTTATWFNLDQFNSIGGTASPIAIFVNGAFRTVSNSSGTYTLPAGTKILRVQEGPQSRPGDAVGTDVQVNTIQKITFSPGSTNTIISPVASDNRIVIRGDSILANGYTSDVPGRDGAGVQLRTLIGCDVLIRGWGASSNANSLGTDPDVEQEAQYIVGGLQGATNKTYIHDLVTNDEVIASLNSSPALATARTAKLIDRVHEMDSSITIYVLTRTFQSGNSSTAFADSQRTLLSSRPWLHVIDPVLWNVVADTISDGLHLTTAGHLKLANYLLATLAGQATPGNLAGQGNGWVTVPQSDLGYTITSKTSAPAQAGQDISGTVSASSTSNAFALTAGWERWASAPASKPLFIDNEALVTSDPNAAAAFHYTPGSDGNYRAAYYAPKLKGFGIIRISTNGGSSYFDFDQSSSGAAVNSDFISWLNSQPTGQDWTFKMAPGQPAGTLICIDHFEFVKY